MATQSASVQDHDGQPGSIWPKPSSTPAVSTARVEIQWRLLQIWERLPCSAAVVQLLISSLSPRISRLFSAPVAVDSGVQACCASIRWTDWTTPPVVSRRKHVLVESPVSVITGSLPGRVMWSWLRAAASSDLADRFVGRFCPCHIRHPGTYMDYRMACYQSSLRTSGSLPLLDDYRSFHEVLADGYRFISAIWRNFEGHSLVWRTGVGHVWYVLFIV